MPSRLHIVGRKNSGKTTLICELVRELQCRGLRVATIKHTHHRHELDTPGKDSHKHREAGAAAVGILTPQMTAAFIPMDRQEMGQHRYAAFDMIFSDFDLILVEGDLQTTASRLEVWHSAVSEPPYAATDTEISAVISDECPGAIRCAVWSRTDIAGLADKILRSSDLS
ncbi:MAG: molybdopterin-guanine dinucleotide biosynthesis protein B [Planctomycetota bacterium]